MKKKLLSLIMVLILSFVSVNEVRADAGSLIIAGGSIAGGVAAGAFAGPAVVAVFCAMMAFGMNVELTEASEESGMTKTEFLKSKIQEYCNEVKISANTFNSYVLDQAQVLQNGSISISNKAGEFIEKFCNWCFEYNQVNQGIAGTITLNGIECPVINQDATGTLCTVTNVNGSTDAVYYYVKGNHPMAMVCVDAGDDSLRWVGISANEETFEDFEIKTECIINGVEYGDTKTSYNWLSNGIYVVSFFSTYNSYITNNNFPVYNGTFEDFCEGITSLDLGSALQDQNTITGDHSIYDTSKGVLNPADDHTIVINPNITIPVPQDKDVTIDVNTYIEKIQELIDGLRDDVIQAIDKATDMPITIEFDPTQDWDPTIEDEDDTELPPIEDRTPIIKDDIIPHDFDPDPMKFDLKGIFPFCIPWDVKDMLNKLSADPVAPSYTVNWMIPIVNERLIFTVDLAPFNGVAQVCRTMELLAFCIGLAVVTRQLFLRG